MEQQQQNNDQKVPFFRRDTAPTSPRRKRHDEMETSGINDHSSVQFVGWVERSGTHQSQTNHHTIMVGFASLHPPYELHALACRRYASDTTI